MFYWLAFLSSLYVAASLTKMTTTTTTAVHEPMKEQIYFYPRPGDEASTHHVYVKPGDLITRNSLQLITDWPYPGDMVGEHVQKPIDLVATAEVSSQPIYFRKRENILNNSKLKQKQNILYLELPMLSTPQPNAGIENKVEE